MSEYLRAKHEGTGEVFQWCDTTLYCVIDTHTLKPERFGKHGAATGTLQEALWGLCESDARQELTRKATGDRHLPCWVKQVVRR